MIHSVSKEMITAIQCVPRIAERVTPAAAAHQKVCQQLCLQAVLCIVWPAQAALHAYHGLI